MNLGQRKIHLWRTIATLLLCTIATGTPPAALAAVLPQKNWLDAGFTQLGRDFWVGVVARLKGDETSARAAFMRARTQQEEEIRVHPDDMSLLSDLGLIDAALGRKEEALNEGRRAVELLAIQKMRRRCTELTNLAITYAWTGERELALRQLEALCRIPSLASLMATCV